MNDDVSQVSVTSSTVPEADRDNPEVAGGTSGPDGVCRDYLRNVCRRGERCRFLHPADPTSARRDVIAQQSSRRGEIVFCHDFQNASGCRRGAACRFAHCTRQQEAVYRRTGVLPVGAQRKLAIDYALTRALWKGETPVCIDYLKAGGCRRANGQCRYRHVTQEDFEREQLCAMAEMPEVTTRMRTSVYRKRKAPSSVDNDDADDDDDEERYSTNPDTTTMLTSAKHAVYLAPTGNNFRFGCQPPLDDLRLIGAEQGAGFLTGNNFRLVPAQPPAALLPVAILPAAPLGVLTAVRSAGACDVIGVYDRTPVAPATVAMPTSVICPVAQWL